MEEVEERGGLAQGGERTEETRPLWLENGGGEIGGVMRLASSCRVRKEGVDFWGRVRSAGVPVSASLLMESDFLEGMVLRRKQPEESLIRHFLGVWQKTSLWRVRQLGTLQPAPCPVPPRLLLRPRSGCPGALSREGSSSDQLSNGWPIGSSHFPSLSATLF